ncbi:hypothetical protein [Pusillimonas minor]|uniref:Lipoprotein n=1 Tax=Pusillimonas minor TaxID=2697024 RepID=A0A842HKT5_9BURK|nr:hypothetical protein [Pusillimonas minor]MBC2768554.1 hypothetical protein [Pusillimonas minor]
MKKTAFVLCALVALSGCAQYSNQANGYDVMASVASNNFEIESNRLEKLQASGQISQLELSKGLLAAQQRYIPNETAYGLYLVQRQNIAQKLSDGAITDDQFSALNMALHNDYASQVKSQANRAAAQQSAENYYKAVIGAQAIQNLNLGRKSSFQPLTPALNCTSTPFAGSVTTTCY